MFYKKVLFKRSTFSNLSPHCRCVTHSTRHMFLIRRRAIRNRRAHVILTLSSWTQHFADLQFCFSTVGSCPRFHPPTAGVKNFCPALCDRIIQTSLRAFFLNASQNWYVNKSRHEHASAGCSAFCRCLPSGPHGPSIQFLKSVLLLGEFRAASTVSYARIFVLQPVVDFFSRFKSVKKIPEDGAAGQCFGLTRKLSLAWGVVTEQIAWSQKYDT